MWVARLAVEADDGAVVVLVGGEEVGGVVVGVHVDLGQTVVHVRVDAALVGTRLQELTQDLEPVALLHLR